LFSESSISIDQSFKAQLQSSIVLHESKLLNCISQAYSGLRLRRDEVFPEFSKELPLKFSITQREKSNLLQDIATILKGEKNNLKTLVSCLPNSQENLKKRNLALLIAKQIYLSNSVGFRTLKR
jgi:hypothetical protein